MADSKISQLTGATTPLAGTEELPLVQSSSTKKVTVANLTAGRTVAAASVVTTGNIGAKNASPTTPVMVNTRSGGEPTWRGDVVVNQTGSSLASDAGIEWKVDGAASGYGGRLLSYFDGNNAYNIAIQMRNNSAAWTTRLDLLANGNVAVSTGNLVIGTSGKGIDFSADGQAAGMTSELLDDYEEGTWTPIVASNGGAITTLGTCTGQYTKIGRQVTLSMDLRITVNGTGSGFLNVSGIPINIGATLYGAGCGTEIGSTGKMLQINPATQTTINITNYDSTYPGADGFRGSLIWTYFV